MTKMQLTTTHAQHGKKVNTDELVLLIRRWSGAHGPSTAIKVDLCVGYIAKCGAVRIFGEEVAAAARLSLMTPAV